MRCEQRTLDDIRAMGGNSPEDERRFATAARVSEINLAALPEVRAALGQGDGDAADGGDDAQAGIRCALQYEAFSGENPLMNDGGSAAEQVREHRKPVAVRQSVLSPPGDDVEADRRCARQLA